MTWMKPIRESLIPFKSLPFLYRVHCFEQQHFSYRGEGVGGMWSLASACFASTFSQSLADWSKMCGPNFRATHPMSVPNQWSKLPLSTYSSLDGCGWLYGLLYAHPHFEHKVLNLHFCSIGEGGHWLPRRWAGDVTLSEWWIKENKGWKMKVSAKRPFRPGWIYCYCNHHQYPTIAHSTFVIGSGHYLTLLSLSRMKV